MWAISTMELTLGYFTEPVWSAAGLAGSYFMRNADRSGATLPSATILASSVRSSAEEKVGILRRYGSAPDAAPVESALAMVSEITSIHSSIACRPEVATLIHLP